jgi:hypothetical protein
MTPRTPALRLVAPGLLALTAAVLTACGGGQTDETATARDLVVHKGGSCSGSCTGGGGTPVPGASNPLPTAAPAPDILLRESFGPGPQGLRPKGGKGDMRSTFIGTTLGGFWVEWPGSKGNAWITPGGEATWKFTAAVQEHDPVGNPYELPSPLEVGGLRGQVFADVSDGATGGFPAALLPVRLPATAYAVSMEGYPQQALPGAYLALGLTDSGATLNNLASVGKVTLLLRPAVGDAFSRLAWELWTGGAARALLASGLTDDATYNRLQLAYDPQSQLLSASVNGQDAGRYSVNLGAPRYAGFEGAGLADNFVIRTLPVAAQ